MNPVVMNADKGAGILGSPQNPKIPVRDDTEIVGYTLRRVVLLTVNRSVLLQNTVDDIREGGQFRAFRWLASPISRRFRMPQHLPHRPRAQCQTGLAASRWLRPSTWQASRTRRYRSHGVHPPTFHLKKDRRLQVAEFYSARGWEIPPLPWTNLSPPFSAGLGDGEGLGVGPRPQASHQFQETA